MYSTKTATTNNQEFNSSYMPVGINENVHLKEVTVEKSPTGRDFIRITFENNQGQTAEMTEWKNEKNMWIKTDEDLQNRDNQQFGRLLQVIDAVCGKHDDFEGSSFAEMINWVRNTLVAAQSNIMPALRLKVIYDNKGYTRVSSYGIFVEPMTTTESQIKLFKRDLLERPIVADQEPATDPLVADKEYLMANAPVTADSTGADDLPF